MRKAQEILIVLAAILGPQCFPAETETEELIARLGSEDFDTREAAAKELGTRAEKIWTRLEKLEQGENAEVRGLARRAMCDAGKRALNVAIAGLKRKIEEGDAALRTAEENVPIAEKAEKEAEFKASTAQNELRADEKELQKRARVADENLEAAIANAQKAKETLEKSFKTWRLEHMALESRVLQFQQFMESNVMILPAEVPSWTPAKLKFEQRLKCKISFEFVDLPLPEVLAWISEACGAKIELSPDVKDVNAAVCLRVSDMQAGLALSWICKLTELEYTVDLDKQTVVLHKPANLE